MTKTERKWRWLVNLLPRHTRIELLEALAYPEFEVNRLWLRSDGGQFTVERIPLAETEDAEARARLELQLYAPAAAMALTPYQANSPCGQYLNPQALEPPA